MFQVDVPQTRVHSLQGGVSLYLKYLQFDWLEISCFNTHKYQHNFMFGQIQLTQTGDQLYSDTSSY